MTNGNQNSILKRSMDTNRLIDANFRKASSTPVDRTQIREMARERVMLERSLQMKANPFNTEFPKAKFPERI